MKRFLPALVASLVAMTLAACTTAPDSALFSHWDSPTSTAQQSAPTVQQYTAALDKLTVRPQVFVAGYHRGDFLGQEWPEIGGCSVRELVLARDLEPKKVDRNCHVAAGVLTDPYNGQSVDLATTADGGSSIEIDHTVSLLDAFISGAKTWAPEKKHAFAIDPLNLKATSTETNQAKDWYAADRWQPTTTAGKCLFAQTVVTVKTRYVLSVTAAERTVLTRDLASCGGK